MVYAGFWRRFGAYLVDVICITVLTSASWWINEQTRFGMLIWFLPGFLIGIWYHVHLVKRYGGTPGKLVLGVRIVKLDGTPVGYKEALLRYSPLLVLAAY